MFVNPFFYPALLGGILLYYGGRWLGQSARGRRAWWWLVGLSALLCLPGLAFDLYYMHLVGDSPGYVEFRSLTGIETLAACWGLFFGLLSARWQAVERQLRGILSGASLMVCAIVLLTLPFCKAILSPVEATGALQNRWQDDICQQTSGSTCGPASLATIFRALGLQRSEREIARASYTGGTGTELWYLIRYARGQGLHVAYLRPARLAQLPIPAILGINPDAGAPRAGHFVTLLGKTGDRYLIGDPMGGRSLVTENQFSRGHGNLRDAIVFSR